jgi:hypothetical protein
VRSEGGPCTKMAYSDAECACCLDCMQHEENEGGFTVMCVVAINGWGRQSMHGSRFVEDGWFMTD